MLAILDARDLNGDLPPIPNQTLRYSVDPDNNDFSKPGVSISGDGEYELVDYILTSKGHLEPEPELSEVPA